MSKRRAKIVHDDHLVLAEHMIKENEELCLELYHDSLDNLTGGYGHNFEEPMPIEAANLLLDIDIREAIEYLGKYGFYTRLSDIRKAVLIDMMLNMGPASFARFKRMIKALSVGDWDEAARQIQDSVYWDQVKIRAKRNYLMMKFDRWFTRPEAASYFKNGNI